MNLKEFLQTVTSSLAEFGLINTIAIEFIPAKYPYLGKINAFSNGVIIKELSCSDCRYNTLLAIIVKELELLANIKTDNDYFRSIGYIGHWDGIALTQRISELLTMYNKDKTAIKVAMNDLTVGKVLFIYS